MTFRSYPRNLTDQNFGLCISPDDLIFPFYYHCGGNYCRPWRWFNQTGNKDSGSSIEEEKDTYKITLDVQHFKPDEISVKVNNNEIVVQANHEEKQDEHGYISRRFTRRYVLPYECLTDTVECTLSSDGILILTAKKMSKSKESKEIVVPIQICATSTKSNQSESKEITESAQKDDLSKVITSTKDNQIMLKDGICRSLKPELLGPAVTETSNKHKATEGQLLSQITEGSAKSKINVSSTSEASSKMTSQKVSDAQLMEASQSVVSDKMSLEQDVISKAELVQETTGAILNSEMIGKSAAFEEACSQAISASSSSVVENTLQLMDSMKMSAGATSKTQEIMEILETSSAKTNASGFATQEKIEDMTMEVSEQRTSGSVQMSESFEETNNRAGVTSTIEEMIEKCSAEIAEIANKYSESSFMSSSEAAMHSMSFSSSEVQESSYSSSSSTTVKASGERATGLVCDIIAELKEAAENEKKKL